MTTLTITNELSPAAELGPQNPLPQLNRSKDGAKPLVVHESVPMDYRKYLALRRQRMTIWSIFEVTSPCRDGLERV